ncbi:MAG: polyprenyl synthetase family protein, partial [Firmicutes bacterium]|nr:polyprenyl synthetase family protein [Bacillota bacterium]
IGRAFQVRDDILDATSTSEQLGKTAGKDLTQGKFTYVAAFGLDGAGRKLKALLDEADEIAEGLPGDPEALCAAIGLLRQ